MKKSDFILIILAVGLLILGGLNLKEIRDLRADMYALAAAPTAGPVWPPPREDGLIIGHIPHPAGAMTEGENFEYVKCAIYYLTRRAAVQDSIALTRLRP